MSVLLKDELERIREDHVVEQNKRYHSIMTTILDNALNEFDLDSLRKEFVQKIQKNPEKTAVSCSYTLKLDKLFGSPYSWRATKDGKKEFINNPNPPYELWFNTPRGAMKRVIFDINSGSHTLDGEFQDYFLKNDAHIQRLKAHFQKAFPDAKQILFLYMNANENSYLQIELKMNLNTTITGLQ